MESRLDNGLNISVVFTYQSSTRRSAALKQAGSFGESPQHAYYAGGAADRPAASSARQARRCLSIGTKIGFARSREQSAVDTAIQIYLCRDRWEALFSVLKPYSLVVIGGKKRWWPTPESRLANKLRNAGHEVILTETE